MWVHYRSEFLLTPLQNSFNSEVYHGMNNWHCMNTVMPNSSIISTRDCTLVYTILGQEAGGLINSTASQTGFGGRCGMGGDSAFITGTWKIPYFLNDVRAGNQESPGTIPI
jgi:hypothetical protein